MTIQTTMMQMPLTLTHLLDRAKTLGKNREIITRLPDKSLHKTDWLTVAKRAENLAASLQKLGIQIGERVATLSWNHAAHLECYLGIPAMGAVLHTLNLRLAPQDIAYIVDHAEDRVVIIDDVLLPLWNQVFSHLNNKNLILIIIPFGGKEIDENLGLNYENLVNKNINKNNWQPVILDENAPAAMCYTSGTTGRPKGVVYSHRSIMLHALTAGLPDYLGISRHDVVLPVVPMFHVNAWGIPFVAALLGTKLVFPGPHLDAVSLLDLMQSERVNLAAGVPTLWMGLLNALNQNPKQWDLVKPMTLIVGGSATPTNLMAGLDAHGLNLVCAWGMTEVSPLGSIARLDPKQRETLSQADQLALRTTAGLPAPFVEMQLFNADSGESQPWDGASAGELQLRGQWITGAYFKNDGVDAFENAGWFGTGDVATLSEDGFLRITDRTKDLIKSGGEWISSVEIENLLMTHPSVAEAAVIAVPHPKWSERPLACVVLKADALLDKNNLKSELMAYLGTQHLAKWSIPDAYVLIDAVPKTSVGKFNKRVLRDQFPTWDF